MRSSLAMCAGLAVSLWSANAAMAEGPEVIVSSIQASETSLIPGDPNGERFQSDFNNLYRSPNGTRWIVTNETGSGFASKSILTGSGNTFTVPAFIPSGGLAPWVDINSPQVFNTFGVVYAINDAGQWAMGVRESVNARIVKFDSGVWSFPAIEGDEIPGVPGKVWGTSFDVYSLNANGSVLNFRGSDTGVVEDYFFRGSTLTVQTPVTIPTGQVGTSNLAWQNFGDSGYGMADGNGNWFVVGDLTGTANDDVAVLNGAVVAQQGATFGSIGVVANSRISVPYLTGNGAHWYLRGTTGSTHWIAKDGVVIAQTGAPIIAGSTDLYANVTGIGRTFVSAVGDNAGNYVIIGGASDGVNPRGVAVYNGTKILLSEGDPIDVDGNGNFDDDVFVLGLAAVDFYTNFLGEDGYWYAIVSTRQGGGAALGEALVRVRVTPACTADINGTGGVTADDIFAFLDAWFVQNGQTGSGLTADFNSSGSVTADDIFAFLDAWFVQNGNCQ